MTKSSDAGEMSGGAREERRAVMLPSSAPRAIEWAAERLAEGGVVALPTDTVYGIAASLSHPEAVKRLYEIKGRPAHNPIPVLVASPADVDHVAAGLSHDVQLLLDRYWPGPLTIVVPARPGMPREVTAGGDTVGIRMPNHPLAIEVIAKAGGAVACTSANRSGEPPACDAQGVAATIGPELDMILDGGVAPGGVASTVVAVEGDNLRILRNGPIPAEHLMASWTELISGHPAE